MYMHSYTSKYISRFYVDYYSLKVVAAYIPVKKRILLKKFRFLLFLNNLFYHFWFCGHFVEFLKMSVTSTTNIGELNYLVCFK